jgi:hypothetical protein
MAGLPLFRSVGHLFPVPGEGAQRPALAGEVRVRGNSQTQAETTKDT